MLLWLLLSTLRFSRPAVAFVARPCSEKSLQRSHFRREYCVNYHKGPSHRLRRRLKRDDDSDEHRDSKDTKDIKRSDPVLERFLSPRIDDPLLPLTDAGMAQIVAPTLQIYWLLAVNQSASWLRPIGVGLWQSSVRGSLLAPTLIHGAGLASCWVLGALAAKAYEQDAFAPTIRNDRQHADYTRVLLRTIQAGCFSTGLLILATQLDLLGEYHRWVQPGESDDIDLRLWTALVELLNDVFFEAATMITWRLFVARQNAQQYR